jgi:two-component system response regulator
MAGSQELVVLLADDDEDDRLLVEAALSDRPVKLMCVHDGVELIDYLLCHGQYKNMKDYPRPDLILLDLNMPRKDGRQALHEIRAHPKLRAIPVVVLTTSRENCDVDRCYLLGANSYIVKPMTFGGLIQTLDVFHIYWDEASTLPSKELPESCDGERERYK